MKILMYSHDSFGLGHLRRTLALAEALVEKEPANNVLILTGSTISGAYRMSKGIDFVKLPSAIKVGKGEYEPSKLSVEADSLIWLRSRLILGAAQAFEPDAFVVDKAPLGMKGEVEATLEFLREERPGTLTVLGLRDVMDDPTEVRQSWRKSKLQDAIEQFYDRILVYGPREIYDPLPEYGLSQETLNRSSYVGYVGKTRSRKALSEAPFEPGSALATAGGGGDGYLLLESYLEGLKLSEPDFDSLVVTGPLMEEDDRLRLERLAKGTRSRVVEFHADMESLIAGAGAVVAMGGYNTTTELLAAGKPAVIVPRVEPRVEQLIRAERLQALGLLDMIHPHDLTPALLRRKVEELMGRVQNSNLRVHVDLSGAPRAATLIHADAREKQTLVLSA